MKDAKLSKCAKDDETLVVPTTSKADVVKCVPEPIKDAKLPEYYKQVQPPCMTTSSVQIPDFNPSLTSKSSNVELKENNQIPNFNPSLANKSSNVELKQNNEIPNFNPSPANKYSNVELKQNNSSH